MSANDKLADVVRDDLVDVWSHLRDSGAFFPAQLVRLVYQHVRAHSEVFCVCAAVCETEHSITLLEAFLTLSCQLFNDSRELNSEDLGCLRRYWVQSFSLQKVHSVQAECLDADQSLCVCWLWSRDFVDEEGGCWAFAILDI